MDGELAPLGQGRPIGAAPGATPEGGNPKGRNQEQWFFPPFCQNKKGVAVKAKPVVAVMQHSDLHSVLYALLLAKRRA
jgi:hypothetical protein